MGVDAVSKKGKHSVRVASRYASALGKNADCQTVSLARGEVPGLLALHYVLTETASGLREAAVAQYKESLEHAKTIFQDEMQQRDIDAPSNYATNTAICYARMRNTLHEGLRYQLMHPR
jgi:SRSO17 transposase